MYSLNNFHGESLEDTQCGTLICKAHAAVLIGKVQFFSIGLLELSVFYACKCAFIRWSFDHINKIVGPKRMIGVYTA